MLKNEVCYLAATHKIGVMAIEREVRQLHNEGHLLDLDLRNQSLKLTQIWLAMQDVERVITEVYLNAASCVKPCTQSDLLEELVDSPVYDR